MADFPSFDMLSEVEELTMYVEGKDGSSKFDWVNFNENVELNSGIPSHGLMDDGDAMLAVDSSNALLWDPLLNFFDQNELLEHQSASAPYIPETLMPVSLPADSPPPPPPPTSTTTATTHRIADPEPKEADSIAHSTSSSSSSSSCSEATPEGASERTQVVVVVRRPPSPVRIVVKTRKLQRAPGEMVAPLTLQKPARNLVKIPRAAPSGPRARALRSGGKLGPSGGGGGEAVDFSASSAEPPAASSSSSSSGSKRKAYELDPQPDPQKERCRLNAINAKRNRELKKAHLASLERKVEDVTRERDLLAGENESLREAKQRLERQVRRLSHILRKQSRLSALVGGVGPLGDVASVGSGSEVVVVGGGMCLHVEGEGATAGFCSYCAKEEGKEVDVSGGIQ